MIEWTERAFLLERAALTAVQIHDGKLYGYKQDERLLGYKQDDGWYEYKQVYMNRKC